MHYVIKHREKDLYVPGTVNNKAKRFELYLVEKEWAKVYATQKGSKSALVNWADEISNVLQLFEDIEISPKELADQMEIVEVNFEV